MSKKYFTISINGRAAVKPQVMSIINDIVGPSTYIDIIEVFDDGTFNAETVNIPISSLKAAINGKQKDFWELCKSSINRGWRRLNYLPKPDCLFEVCPTDRNLSKLIN